MRRVRSCSQAMKPYHHGDLQRALVDAAVALLAEGGAAAVTLREVARRAGVTHAAPYRHFADKAALLAAVAEEGFRALHDAVARAGAEAPDDPLARLAASGQAYLRFAMSHPAHYRVMFGPDVAAREHPELEGAA